MSFLRVRYRVVESPADLATKVSADREEWVNLSALGPPKYLEEWVNILWSPRYLDEIWVRRYDAIVSWDNLLKIYRWVALTISIRFRNMGYIEDDLGEISWPAVTVPFVRLRRLPNEEWLRQFSSDGAQIFRIDGNDLYLCFTKIWEKYSQRPLSYSFSSACTGCSGVLTVKRRLLKSDH